MRDLPNFEDSWYVFRGTGTPRTAAIPDAPPWRTFDGLPIERQLAAATVRAPFLIDAPEVELINAALHLRRPLLVTGKPGTGKSSLAHAVAHELALGVPLVWPINTRSTLKDGLYRYDAIGRLQTPEASIGRYVQLGPLGTALLPHVRPRVLLIDEVDKSDLDFPNDLLHVLEEGRYEVPELTRLPRELDRVAVRAFDGDDEVTITRGRVMCREFPFIVMTSNGERDFPPAFLRRCIRLDLAPPNPEKLRRIVDAHFGGRASHPRTAAVLAQFAQLSEERTMATDQLLNAIHLVQSRPLDLHASASLGEAIVRELK